MRKNIKRFMKLILVLFLLLGVSACTNGSIDPSGSSTPTAGETSIPTESATPMPSKSETPMPSGSETPIPSVSETPIPSVSETLIPSESESPVLSESQLVIKDLIQEDMDAIASIEVNNFKLNTVNNGPVNNSLISWSFDTNNIAKNGIVLPYNLANTTRVVTATATFELSGLSLVKKYTFELPDNEYTDINFVKQVPFTNHTDEYEVTAEFLNIYQNENGAVPYVSVLEWIEFLEGVIDSAIEFTHQVDNGILTVSYDYTSSDGEVTPLELVLNSNENTITTNDSGFFVAYTESTETNYSRNIYYNLDSDLSHYSEDEGLSLDLGKYNMEVISYEDEILIPFYVANMLFANSNYYGVYYNQDSLHGVYYVPDSGDLNTIQTSSANKKYIPDDLVVHNFNFLALFFDNFYGLKEYKNVDTYYNLLMSNKDALTTKLAVNFDEALFEIINKQIDELHTSFSTRSYYNNLKTAGPQLTSINQLGLETRKFYYALWAVEDEIADKFKISNSSGAASHPNRPVYWDIDGEILIVALDSFKTADIEEKDEFDIALIEKILDKESLSIPEITSGDRFIYYNSKIDDDKYFAEILIKNTSEGYLSAYSQLLIDDGFEKEEKDGFDTFTKTHDSLNYLINLSYDEDFEVFYVGITATGKRLTNKDYNPNITNLIKKDSAIFLEFYIEKALRELPNIQYGILDISMNTGGNVGALYRVMGTLFNTDFTVSTSYVNSNEKSTNVIHIKPPVSFEHIEWNLLTSGVSFSAANMMATIVKYNNLGKIIGQKSGGGTASVTPVYLPNGTIFTASSKNLMSYVVGDNTEESPYEYFVNEGGIEPDYVLTYSDMLKDEVLKAIFFPE